MATFNPSWGFQYPPNGNHLVFNFLDTVNVTWEGGQDNSTTCNLSLWYNPNSEPWTNISENQTVPCSGSQLVGLNVATQGYLGQFNLKYTLSDGGSGLFLSEFFNVNNNPSSTPVIWSLLNRTAASSSTSIGLPGTTTTLLAYTMSASTSLPSLDYTSQLGPSTSLYSVLSSSPPISLPSQSAEESSSLNPRQVAGISIGAVLVILLALTLLGVLLSNRKRHRATAKGQSQARLPEVDTRQISLIGNTGNSYENELLGSQWRELHGQECRAQLRGDGEQWELR